MKAFASVALPAFCCIWCAALLGAFAWQYRRIRQALERRRSTFRAPFRKRLAARCREVLGTPLSVPDDGEPLTDAEKSVLAGYIVAEQENRPLAAEPQHRRLP